MEKVFAKRKIKSPINRAPQYHSEGKQAAVPNSLIMRIMEDPQAEKEANRLSKGITSNTPNEVLSEMGSRLGADFSDVQFHSDSLSMNRSRTMGARAWAQGSDVFFGRGGFDPKVAAHELVHTVQQGAVQGNTAQSAPLGSVQLFSGENEDDIQRRQVSANTGTLQLMQEQKASSEYGARVFTDLVKPAKKLAEKSGRRIRGMNDESSMAFLANLSERDYSGKEIIRDIASRTVINKDEMYDRTDEYEGFMDYMGNRTNKVGLKTAAMQAGVINEDLINQHDNDANYNKRAYEMTEEELANDTFNPTHDQEIAAALRKIDNARNVKEAYHAFLGYTENKEYTAQEIAESQQVINFAQQPIPLMMGDRGNLTEVDPSVAEAQKKINDDIEAKLTAAKNKMNGAKSRARNLAKNSPDYDAAKQEFEGAKAEYNAAQDEKQKKAKAIQFRYKQGATVNLPLLKAKLKNMVRQVRDYPELKHKIGGLNIQWNQKLGAYREGTTETVMSVNTSAGASEKTTINYDAYLDRDSPEGAAERDHVNRNLSKSIGNLNKAGNHELGHVLESTLNIEEEDQHKGVTSNDILQSVLPKVMTQDEISQVQYNQQDGLNEHKKRIYQGQIDTRSPIFAAKKMSSKYGQSMPKEWFAEAFHDVYTKGADAKPTSIEIVKEYERRQTAKQKSEFRKKERGWFTRAKRWFGRKFNFGRRHDEPQAAGMNAVPVPQLPEIPQLPAAGNNPQPVEDEFSHYLENMLPNEAIRQHDQNEENASDLVVEAPKRKNLKKKRKKK